jgi:hypothetical protein
MDGWAASEKGCKWTIRFGLFSLCLSFTRSLIADVELTFYDSQPPLLWLIMMHHAQIFPLFFVLALFVVVCLLDRMDRWFLLVGVMGHLQHVYWVFTILFFFFFFFVPLLHFDSILIWLFSSLFFQ